VEATGCFQTLVHLYQSVRCHIPEDSDCCDYSFWRTFHALLFKTLGLAIEQHIKGFNTNYMTIQFLDFGNLKICSVVSYSLICAIYNPVREQ
jgi:hypothetical protein